MKALSILLLGILLVGAGCQSPAPDAKPAPTGEAGKEAKVFHQKGTMVSIDRVPAELLLPPTEPYHLGAGDLLEVEMIGVRGTRAVAPIMPDGRYYFDLLPGIKVTGMSVDEFRLRLETDLAAFYHGPQVGVTVRGVRSRKVWVMGRVNTPGTYPLDTPMTLVEAVARAGGLMVSRFSGTTEELADLQHSFVVRQGVFLPVDFSQLLLHGDMSQNIYLRDGDYVYLPSALSQEVFVLGAVAQPKTVGFRDRVTLVSALASARGVLPSAHTQRVLIIRGSLAQPEAFTVNLADILAGQAPDVPLRPRDIVWVPNAPWSNLERYVKMVVTTFTRTVAANAGAQFAVPGSSVVGPTLPISTGP
jgi:protein involved in polysaccharide export with SLBB domain